MTAHDLRQSLRDVTAYSQLLSGSCAERLEPEARGFLEHIGDSAARMETLLTAVVEYASLDGGEKGASETDMEAVLQRALLRKDAQIAARNAVVTHDPLPAVLGDAEILTKVLRHLIRNAIGYCDAPVPAVHVSCKQDGQDWVFSVHDNGPGVDLAFQTRIFGVFKRLHGREHPGSGLGLAYCRKAIERMGGRMWMESAPGNGSTFFFALPSAE